MSLFSLLEMAARHFPDRGALYEGETRIRTFAELRCQALALAGGLMRRCPPGSRIVIASENCKEYIELMFAAWAAGLVVAPLNAKLHVKEMTAIIHDCQASIAFVDAKRTRGLSTALAKGPEIPCAAVTVGGAEFLDLYEARAAAPMDPDSGSLAWLFYTSGTTGRSKGAMLSHRNLLAMTIAHLADVESADENGSLIHAAPMSHGSGLYILPYLARGSRQVVPASLSFDPSEFLDLCDLHPRCSAFLAPTMIQRLRAAAASENRNPKGLRTIIYGGGPMYVEEMKKSIEVLGQVFVQIYGQGESPMTITSLRRSDHAATDDGVIGSVGWARSGVDVAVIDGTGTRAPAGVTGEIVCRGDTVMMGYWNDAAATREALRDGWLYTGDLGSFDLRGYLTLRDRSKDLIISGGSNIYPREVEEVLLAHTAVAEACVVGQHDREWGEVVVAFVVRAPGAGGSSEELDSHCLSRIARFKRPKRYIFVNSLPKNSYGKVLRRELRESLPELAPAEPK